MYPVININQLEKIEKGLSGKHVIILLLIKISDSNAKSYLGYLDYLKCRMGDYCSIYLPGYSLKKRNDNDFGIDGPEKAKWYYSNKFFLKFCDELKGKIFSWEYSGEPEMIIFQSGFEGELDFSYYNYIEIDYGIEKGYIDSFPRFMERLYNACRSEVTAKSAIRKTTKITARSIIEQTLEADKKLPAPMKKIIKDRKFYNSYKTKNINLKR